MTSKPASVSAISDVLALIGKRGWLSPPLISVVAAPKPISSRALTFRLEMGEEGPGLMPLYEALSNNLASRCIVLDAQRIDGAVWGEILATAALNAEISAVLMFYAADKRKLRHAMREKGLQEVRFRFDFEGTKVVAQN